MEVRPRGTSRQEGVGPATGDRWHSPHTSFLGEQAVSEGGAVTPSAIRRESRRGVVSLGGSLGGVCQPAESQRETRVPRAGVLGSGEEGRKDWPPRSWFEGSWEGSCSFTQQTSPGNI